jgi:hypothetical protein
MGDANTQDLKDNSAQEASNFLSRLLSLIFGSNDPEKEKKRLLKEIAKDLSRQKYKFYKPKNAEALPALGRFFFEIYKVVGPAQTLLASAEESSVLKTIVIEMNHTDRQGKLRELFTEESIRKSAREVDTKQLTAQIRQSMVDYFSGFDAATIKRINETYSLLKTFVAFVKFDLYFVLRKFDGSIQEGNFTAAPKYETLNAEYVSDDLKDFMEVSLSLEQDADWDSIFDVLREYKGVEIVDRAGWKKILGGIINVLRSGVLQKMVQHIDKNPQFTPDMNVHQEHIVESYLNVLKTQVEATIQRLLKEQQTNKKEQLLRTIFGTTAIQRSKHYTETVNMMFTKKNIAGFLHMEAFNYLKAFLVDYFKGEVRQVVSDLLIVRGEWSDPVTSKKLSDSYYIVMNVAQEITEFDDSLGEEGERGMKLKKTAGRVVERDPATAQALRQQLQEVNEQALHLIKSAAGSLIEIGKILKLLIDDVGRERPELILNWRDLEGWTEEPLKESIVAIYKRIYFFVQLMQMLLKK